jgi:hypothetical protein
MHVLVLATAGVGLSVLLMRGHEPAPAQDAKGPDKAALERTREQVKMLDDLYKNAVVSITNNYVEGQASTPAASVAKEVFEAMHKKGWHHARLIDATGKPKNKANVAKTDFEKKAVAEMKAGKTYYEELAKVDGKDVLRAATIVPVVLKQCATCHGKKEGTLLGTIVYEVPIK